MYLIIILITLSFFGGKIAFAATVTTTTTTKTETAYYFTRTLSPGNRGEDVVALQKFLISTGFLKMSVPTGYYGTQTRSAVIAWQLANGIKPAACGNFGPISRGKLNITLTAIQIFSQGIATFAGLTGSIGASGVSGPVGATGVTGLTGTQGPTGATGATGPAGTSSSAGTSWLNGSGNPAGTLGLINDFYIDTSSGDYYRKTATSTWALLGNLVGRRGSSGSGATGATGSIGVTGATGTQGIIGVTGLQGTAGATGTQGIIGVTGSQGAAGSIGPTGATGTPGSIGATGATGTPGSIGATGATGVIEYADYFALMPPDNSATVAPGAPIQFPQNGSVSVSGAITRLSGTSPSLFVLAATGTYQIIFQVSVDEAGQLVLGLDSGGGMMEVLNSTVGRANGTSQIIGMTLITTTVPNSVLSVRNPTGNPIALTLTTIAGGTLSVSAHLTILKIK